MRNFFTILIIFLFFGINSNAQIQLEQTEVDTSTIITGLDIPWEIQWGPDDWLWVTERYGRVSRVNPETGEQNIILDISPQVYQSGESGLLGMVLHPEFDTNPYVYMAYTYRPSTSILEKIVRYTYSSGQLLDETVLLDNIRGNTTHDGCRLLITPDMKLLATTGDAQNLPASQNINDLSGKVLRINLDGSIPDDNPWPGNPVWSFGHRNAQGLYLAPNGILYSSEHGPATDDELNIIEVERNYGWPDVHGYCDLPDEITFCDENNVAEPIAAWTPTVAASDIVFYDHPSIPEFQNSILMTTLKNKRLYVMKLNESGTEVLEENQYFNGTWGRLRDICIGPDGALYLATNGPDWGNSEPFTHSIVKVWNADWSGVGLDETDGKKKLIEIYPNPASGAARIRYLIHNSGFLISDLYMSDGRKIRELVRQEVRPGELEIVFDTSDLPSGMYFVRMQAGNEVSIQKLFVK
jgi:glucose/arabinose dehydrogenase